MCSIGSRCQIAQDQEIEANASDRRVAGILIAVTIIWVVFQYDRGPVSAQPPVLQPLPVRSNVSVKSKAQISNWQMSPIGDAAALTVYETGGKTTDTTSFVMLVHTQPQGDAKPVVIRGADDPAWSPDGRLIAYVKRTNRPVFYPKATGITKDVFAELKPKESRIEVYSLHDRSTTSISTGHEDDSPTWNSTGTSVAFFRLYALQTDVWRQLAVVRRNGGTYSSPVLAVKNKNGLSNPQWGPRSNEIAYLGWRLFNWRGKLVNDRDLYLTDATGRLNRRLTTSKHVCQFGWGWSPDGKYIAFATEKSSYYEMHTLDVIDVDAGSRRTVLQGGGGAILETITWSPNGQQLAVGISSVGCSAEGNIAVVQLRDGRFHWLTDDGRSQKPRWSSDGLAILYVRNETEIWEMNPDGTHQKRLVDSSAK